MSAQQHRRRLDRMLADDYLHDLAQRTTDEIRMMREACEEEESGISYARRVVQGNLDIVAAEIAQRETAGDATARDLHASLAATLADRQSPSEPSRARAMRFLVPFGIERGGRMTDRVADEAAVGDVEQIDTERLGELTTRLSELEQGLSSTRHVLFDRIDALRDELARRYKSGEADVREIISRRI